jgi:hypothetical protein
VHRKGPGVFRKSVNWVFGSVIWIITLPFYRMRHHAADEVTIFSVDSGFFLWLTVAAGFALSILVHFFPKAETFAGWAYAWIVIYLVVTLIYDINAKVLALLIIIFLMIVFGLKYVEHVQNLAILGAILKYFSLLKPQFDAGTATFISWILLIPLTYSLFHVFANGRKKFTPNEIGEFHFLEGDELSDRQGLRFRTKYRDVLETLLTFGGGDLIALDINHNEIKRYPNILFLWFIWPKLEKIINQRAVVEDK